MSDETTMITLGISNTDSLQDLAELLRIADKIGIPDNAHIEVSGLHDEVTITWALYNLEGS